MIKGSPWQLHDIKKSILSWNRDHISMDRDYNSIATNHNLFILCYHKWNVLWSMYLVGKVKSALMITFDEKWKERETEMQRWSLSRKRDILFHKRKLIKLVSFRTWEPKLISSWCSGTIYCEANRAMEEGVPRWSQATTRTFITCRLGETIIWRRSSVTETASRALGYRQIESKI